MILTNFDDIHFRIEADARSGVYSDWNITPIEVSEMVPYSSIWITEHIGYQPATVTWRLEFDDRETYFAFLAKLRAVGTLTILAGFQSLKGTQVTLGNPPRVYEVLDQVKLVRIADQSLEVGGTSSCSATFERNVDPITRLAVI